MPLYRDEGVVLRTYKLGEADRIAVILTRGRGKVRAVAKGVRRTRSRLGGRLEPLSHLRLQLWEGRELDVVSQAETLEVWPGLHEDLRRLSDALALVEAVEQVAQEGQAAAALYDMLVAGLRTLAERPSPVLVAGFYLKLLGLDGARPVLDVCARCGDGTVDLVAFDLSEGGTLCRACRRGQPLSPAALGVLRRMLGGDLAGALATPPGAVAEEVTALATRAVETHLERRLRVLRTYEGLQRH